MRVLWKGFSSSIYEKAAIQLFLEAFLDRRLSGTVFIYYV